MDYSAVEFTNIMEPECFADAGQVFLTDQTMQTRKQNVLDKMKEWQYDSLVIYADKEHGSNFEYLTGFIPRFEESVLVINQNGEVHGIFGNENLKMVKHSRMKHRAHHYPAFSLPNQPMIPYRSLESIFAECGLAKEGRIGIVGWKMFTEQYEQNRKRFDVPHFIIEALLQLPVRIDQMENATHLFIGDGGVRTINNANEIAHYEYGANLASTCMMRALNAVEPGIRERELGTLLNYHGQTPSVVTIAATGDRFRYANLYPTDKQIRSGDPVSLTVGYKGGLSSRCGFAVHLEEELPNYQQDYLSKVVKPYYYAVATWLKLIKTGVTGAEIYDAIDGVLPRDDYGWHLNPGHLTADEEWLASPIYYLSSQRISSGMIFQIDIIPSIQGYTGTSAEDTVAVADDKLQQEIARDYPQLWQRICIRRTYIKEVLQIDLSDEILPLSNTVGYLRPFLLNKERALRILVATDS